MVLYDTLVRGVHDGEIHSDYNFELLEYNGKNEVVRVIYTRECGSL